MKCSKCEEDKDSVEFSPSKQSKSGKTSWCKECKRKTMREHHRIKSQDPEYRRGKSQASIVRSRRNKKIIDKYQECGCIICDEKETHALVFHHVDPRKKEIAVSSSVLRALHKTLAEIKKCVVLCRNCHAKVHAGILDISAHPSVIQVLEAERDTQ